VGWKLDISFPKVVRRKGTCKRDGCSVGSNLIVSLGVWYHRGKRVLFPQEIFAGGIVDDQLAAPFFSCLLSIYLRLVQNHRSCQARLPSSLFGNICPKFYLGPT
jgi:hypothetical protein